jgi:sugar phosphate isomerase/epimerase
MKLAVSNIAWTNEEELVVAKLLQKLGVRYVEIAPTKNWKDPTQTSIDDFKEYRVFWQSYGIEIIAFQSMLFNRPDLKIFEDEENRRSTLEYLKKFIDIAGTFNAGVMVFGSPKNRQRGDLSLEQARRIAIPFFNELAETAQEQGTILCIEPNAPQYACDFIVNTTEGIELVKAVHNNGFGLHLDIACMTLAGDDVAESIKIAAPYLRHFHISSPMLEQVEARKDVKHSQAAQALRDIKYNGFVSIEMRPVQEGENLARVETAVRFAQSVYSS